MWALAKRGYSAFTAASLGTRLAISLGILAILGAGAFFAISRTISAWNAQYERGHKAGKDEVTAQWNAAQAEVVRLNREIETKWRGAGDAAVAAYLAEHKAREAAVQIVTKERVIYVADKANAVACVDRAGVGLLQANRSANGIPASPATAPAAR